MPLTANRELNRYVDQELRTMPVAEAAHVFKGALVGIERETGFVRNLEAGDLFAGIAYEEIDNTDGDGGDLSVRLYTQGDFILSISHASQASVGAPVYAVDSDSTTVLPASGGSQCGVLLAVVGVNLGIVRIMPMSASQLEHAISVPLASSTGAATTNPVMITQRAIRVLHAQVSFNTVPGAGALDVGTDNSDPDELVDAFDLTSLTAHVPAALTLNFRDVAANQRIWAKVGQASSPAGVGGVLTLRYIELP